MHDSRTGAPPDSVAAGGPPPPPTDGPAEGRREPTPDPDVPELVMLAGPVERAAGGPQPGQLTPPWRVMAGLAWVGAVFAYAAVWQASVQLGIGLWWVGPRSQPTPVWIKLIPFLGPVAMLLATAFGVRRLPILGLLASAVAVLVSIPDFGRSTGLATTELVIAGAVALVSATSFTGLYRVAEPAQATDTADTADTVHTGETGDTSAGVGHGGAP